MAQRTIELTPLIVSGMRQGHLLPVITDCELADLDELWVQGLSEGGVIKVDHQALKVTREYRLGYYASGAPSAAVAIANHTGYYWVPQGAGVLNSIIVTADRTLTAGESGSVISNAGAAGTVTVALPAAVPGLWYQFLVEAVQQLRIDPNGTETIALPSTGVQSSAGAYIVADALTEGVTIYCNTAGSWDVLRFTGTWTAV